MSANRYAAIVKPHAGGVTANLSEYQSTRANFSWAEARRERLAKIWHLQVSVERPPGTR